MNPRITGAVLCSLLLAGCTIFNTAPSTDTPTQENTPPDDEPLIAPFTPSTPCELQNDQASVSDNDYCRSEIITEVVAVEGDGVIFIHRTFHRGYGCWSGINVYTYELHVCDLASGGRTILAEQPTTPLVFSPDGGWLAFGVIDTEQFEPHLYRIQSNGENLQQLDTKPLPEWVVSVNQVAWSDEGQWVMFQLWDGTAEGWHAYRIKADGSGDYEPAP